MKKIYILLVFVISMAYSSNLQSQAWTSISTDVVFGYPLNYQQTQITAMKTDVAGNVWVGGYQSGAAMYNGSYWTRYVAVYPYTTHLGGYTVNGIAFDSHGNKWFTTEAGVSKFDGFNWTSYSSNTILEFPDAITVDLNDTIWVGSQAGLSKFDGTAFVHVSEPGELVGTMGDVITNLAVDNHNNKWLSKSENYSLEEYNGTTFEQYFNIYGPGHGSDVISLASDQQGNVWFGGYWWGVQEYDGTNWVGDYDILNSGLGDNQVTSIFIDRNNNKWFGGDSMVSKFDGTNWTVYKNNGYLNGQVTQICEDLQGNIWFGGTWYEGSNFLCKFNPCAPSPADTIIGSNSVCKNSHGILYTAPDIINATSYLWTLPSGDTITTSTDTLYANFSANAVNGYIKVQGKNSCGLGNSFSKLITFHSCLPNSAQTIIGASTACQGQQGVIYTTPLITNATSYFWTLPSGDTVTTSTDTLYANFPTWVNNGYLSVQGENIYGLGIASSKFITFNLLPEPPASIIGETNICTGNLAHFYQADTVSGANAYVFEFSNGIGETNYSGPFFNIIFDSTTTSGYLSVRCINNCGISPDSTSIYINVKHKPNTPESISSPDVVCADQQIYMNVNNSNPDGSIYEWTFPQGINIQWGENDLNWIYLSIDHNASSGNIVVRAHNDDCGYSDSIFKYITVRRPIDSLGSIIGPANVCTSQSNIIFSITPSNNIDSYSWYFPTWDVSGSSNTDSIALTFSMYSETIYVQGHNACGDSPVTSFDVNVLDPIPNAPGWIDGPTDVCFGQNNVVYSVPNNNNYTTFIWNLPDGATGSSDSNSIAVNFGTVTAGSISVKAQTICGISIDSSSIDININYKPAQPDPIYGPEVLCAGQQVSYQTNYFGWDLSNYSWTFPQGVSLDDGGNYAAYVTFNSDAVSGYVTVKAHNDCGFSDSTIMFVTVNHVPDSIYPITGPRNVCQYDGDVVYTAPTASNVDYYTWGIPWDIGGWSITNSIGLYFNNYSTLITVQAHNTCGDSPISNVYINVMNSTPDPVQTITGLTDVCAGQTNVVYSAYSYNMDTITNALMYVWTFPSGIIDTTYTYSLNATISANEVGGNITVQPMNSCGINSYAQLAINVNHIPAKPDYFNGSADVLCAGQQAWYQTNILGGDISNYSWTFPQGATLDDGGLDWVDLTFNSDAVSGYVTIKAHNDCGFSDSTYLYVTVNHPPDSIYPVTGPRDVCQYSGNVIYTAPSATNIDYYTWNLPNGYYGWSHSNSINVWVYGGSDVINVQGHNSCGDSPITPIQVNVLTSTPDAAGLISGLTTVSQTQNNVIYTVPVINNATTYIWTLPNGETVSTVTDSIIVDFTFQTSGFISVIGSNPCGNGDISTLAVNVIPSSIANLKIKSSSDTTCQGSNITYTATCSSGGNNPIYNWYVNDVLVKRDSNYINGLVAYYPFNNNANDESSNGNNGTIYGATLTSDRFGNPNSAYYFGDGNYIKASSNDLPTNDRTVSLWFKANSTSSMPTLLGYGGNSCGQSFMMMINVCGWGENYFYTQAHCNANGLDYSSVNPISPTLWYNWVVTINGNLEKMYLNGVMVSSSYNFYNQTYVDSKDLSIGVNVAPTGYAPYIDGCTGWFDGSLDDIRIYDHPLTDTEVSTLYDLIGKSTFTYIPSNNDNIKCIVTTSGALPDTTIATSNIITMKVNQYPDNPASITGLTTVNQGQSNVTYNVPIINNATSYIWTLPSGVTGNSDNNSIVVNYGNSVISDNIYVKGHNSCGDGNPVSLFVYVNNTNRTLQITAMLQEYYNSGSSSMNQTQGIDWNSGNLYNNFAGTTVDTLTVLIRKTNASDFINPCTIDTLYYSLNLNMDGTITPISIPSTITGYHYIVVIHRNSIETWSDSVDFSPSIINYNFNTHISQFALDGGMYIDESNLAYIWGGDVNQNGNLESEDATEIYVAAISEDETMNNGYVINDVDGNGNIDSQDYGLAYSNALIGANVINPFSYQKKK